MRKTILSLNQDNNQFLVEKIQRKEQLKAK
jgi:hypothetical protein